MCTTIDVHETGNIPILLSLPQMMNLGLDLKLRPDFVEVTCEALGYHKEKLPFTTSKHVAMDLSRVQGKFEQESSSKSSVNTDQAFLNTEASTEVPTEASSVVSESDSEWQSDEELDQHTFNTSEVSDGCAYPVRRRLTEKNDVE